MSQRRQFIKNTTMAGFGVFIAKDSLSFMALDEGKKRIGMIGLDTSHCVAFAKALNVENQPSVYAGYKVVAAYPYGSREIQSSYERIPGYTDSVKQLGVEIVDSIETLLEKVDVVLLETNDGRLHLEQAALVIKARKPVFIDKPIAASLKDTLAIFELARKKKVPVFSSSSLRYVQGAQEIAQGKIGKVLGADTYSPMKLEKTHPDLFWYGINGVESLFTVMGTGCQTVTRMPSADNDVSVGVWTGNRIGTFRGLLNGKQNYGGTAFGEKDVAQLGTYTGYDPLLVKIIEFFETGIAPVTEQETLEIVAFMEAADESKRLGGTAVSLEDMFKRAGRK